MGQAEEKLAVLTAFQQLKVKVGRHIDAVVQAEGLTPLQGCLLTQVFNGAASVGEVSERLHVGQANTSTMCKKLESAGYLTRTRNPQDERMVLLTLTEQGRAAMERIQGRAARYERALAQLPEQVREDMIRGLEAANAALDYLDRHLEGEQN